MSESGSPGCVSVEEDRVRTPRQCVHKVTKGGESRKGTAMDGVRYRLAELEMIVFKNGQSAVEYRLRWVLVQEKTRFSFQIGFAIKSHISALADA